MMSYGQRVDISGRNERKYSGFNSVFRSNPNPTLRKQSSVDKPDQNIVHVRNNLRPASKSRFYSDWASPTSPSFDDVSQSPPKDEAESPSPQLRSRFTRNLSMSSRTKRLNRRSLPAFKINEEEVFEGVDLLRREQSVQLPHAKEQNDGSFSPSSPTVTNSFLNKLAPFKGKSPPPVPPRTSSKHFQNRAALRKTEDTLTVGSINVRRVASFPESEAPPHFSAPSKSPASLLSLNLSPQSTSSSTQSLDDVTSPKELSPSSSPINRVKYLDKAGSGLSRQRSHVVRRKVS